MKKSDAIKLFGTGADLARAVGLTRGRISQWPEELTQKQTDLVTGSAIRLGKIPSAGAGRSNSKRSKVAA